MSGWRIGLGPVFAYERIAASRRWQGHALRSLFLVALLAILSLVWVEASHYAHISQQRRLAIVAGDIFLGVSVTQLAASSSWRQRRSRRVRSVSTDRVELWPIYS